MRSPITLLFIALTLGAFAQDDCNPPTATAELEINNVRAVITNGLNHFENDGSSAYQVPKLEPGVDGPNSIYADGLWIGGLDANGQLHLAATSYPDNTGSEFSAGPLRLDGSAVQEQSFCDQYDQVYRADRVDAELHFEYYNRLEQVAQGADPSILTDPPFEDGYNTPDYFYSWPGTNPDSQFESVLAPFWDYNQDGTYDPDDGDFPGFDVLGEADCHDPQIGSIMLLGDQATWYVSNDLREHGISGGEAMGLEVQVMNYAYTSNDALNDATFVRYTIINRSQTTYTDCVISKWVDVELGCGTDDFVGTEVERGLVYGYNGDQMDEDCGQQSGYGNQLAAQGVKILAGPQQDADGLDNPLIADVDLATVEGGIVYAGQGRGYGDGIVDNERIGSRSAVVYLRNDMTSTPGINGEPDVGMEYYRLMNSTWKNGLPITYSGNGVGNGVGNVTETTHMYPGTSDPLGVATDGEVVNGDWSEVDEDHAPGDRRMLLNTSTFTMEPGEQNSITYAYIWAQNDSGETYALTELFAASDLIDSYYEDCFAEAVGDPTGLSDLIRVTQSLDLSPNPATEEVSIQINTIDAEIESVRLYDLSGIQVKAVSVIETDYIRIDLRGLSNGYYLVQLNGRDGSQITSPLIKK